MDNGTIIFTVIWPLWYFSQKLVNNLYSNVCTGVTLRDLHVSRHDTVCARAYCNKKNYPKWASLINQKVSTVTFHQKYLFFSTSGHRGLFTCHRWQTSDRSWLLIILGQLIKLKTQHNVSIKLVLSMARSSKMPFRPSGQPLGKQRSRDV